MTFPITLVTDYTSSRTLVSWLVLCLATSSTVVVCLSSRTASPISGSTTGVVSSTTSTTLWSGSPDLSQAVVASFVRNMQLLGLLSNSLSLPNGLFCFLERKFCIHLEAFRDVCISDAHDESIS